MNTVSSNARIAIVAGPALSMALSEHFNARADWDCYLAPSLEGLPNPESPPPDLLILDAFVCADAASGDLEGLRALGCPIILIGVSDKASSVDALAHLPRPFRLTELLDCVQTALRPTPLASPSLRSASLRLTEKEQAATQLQTELITAREQIATWEAALKARDERIRTLDANLASTRKRLDEAIAKLKAAGAR